MAKPNKRKGYESSKLGSDEEYFVGKSLKERAAAVQGEPDQTDIDNLNRLFSEYNRAHPGRLERMRKDAEMSRSIKERLPKPIVKGIDSNDLKPQAWFPGDLQEVLEKYWPSLWTNKAHMEWFLKHYPGFKL